MGVLSSLMPLVVATRAKQDPNLESLSRIKYLGARPYGVASRGGTRHPGIGRRVCHALVDHFPRVQEGVEEGKERSKEQIADLEEVARPDLCCVSARDRLTTSDLVAGVNEPSSDTSEWCACRRVGPVSTIPRDCARHRRRRLSVAICLIKAMVSAATFGV